MNEFEQVEALDKKLLFALDLNGRESLASISRKLKVSSDSLEKRLKKLESLGVISHHSIQLNQRAFGQIVFKVFLKLQGAKSSRETIVKAIKRLPSLLWVVQTYGNWDICFSLVAPSPAQVTSRLRSLFSRNSVFIADQNIVITAEVFRYPRKHLINEAPAKTFEHAHSVSQYILNDFEKLLLKKMSTKARLSFIELASLCKTTPSKVRYAINNLEKEKVISGYRPRLDLKKLNLLTFKVLLERLDYSTELDKKLKDFCSQNSSVTYLAFQLGRYSAEFDVEVESVQKFNELMETFREKFDGDFRTAEYLVAKGNYTHRVPLG